MRGVAALIIRAHGVGGASDLPLSLTNVVVGAGWALTISFVVLAFAWTTSRLLGDLAGRPVPRLVDRLVSSSVTRWLLRLAALGFTGYVAWPALFADDLAVNPALGVFYVYLWVGMAACSLLLGDVWPVLSPLRTVHLALSRLAGSTPQTGLFLYPYRLGYWPAALGLFAFVWSELVNPDAAFVSTVVTWVLLYTGAMLLGAAMFGDRWFEHADPFEVYFSLVARLSPWGRIRDTGAARDGRLALRNPLDNLDTTPVRPGLVPVLAVLLGSTAFDSFSMSNYWIAQTAEGGGALDAVLRDTLVLGGFVVLVAVTFCAAAMATSGVTGHQRLALPGILAHCLVPIIVGYVFAHYLTLLLEYGQQTLLQLSDPMLTGADYLGTADLTVAYFLSTRPELLAVLKVAFIVTGHVAGVFAAHDRAVRVLPTRDAVAGQLTMLIVMLVYTSGGLLLLFSS